MLSARQAAGLNVALSEATLDSVTVDQPAKLASIVISVPMLGDDETLVTIRLLVVSRIAVSLRLGPWNDLLAKVVPITLDDLSAVVQTFGTQPVYGDRFVDVPSAEGFGRWSDRLSLDHWLLQDLGTHTLALFQESSLPERHLDMQVWFEDLAIFDAEGKGIPLDTFIDVREKWWDALFGGPQQ